MKKIFALLSLILFLTACGALGPQGPVRYAPPDTPGGRMCVVECRKGRDKCVEACQFKERGCIIDMQGEALKSYEAYTQERFKARLPVELRPSSFENPEACVATNCRTFCEETYQDCFEKCGGSVSGGVTSLWTKDE